MKMEFRVAFLTVIAILAVVCYGDVKKCKMNADLSCYKLWEQNQVTKMIQIPPECNDEIAKYDNQSNITLSDKVDSKKVKHTDCGGAGIFWCFKFTHEKQNRSSKAWDKFDAYGCAEKKTAQGQNYTLGCSPSTQPSIGPHDRNGRVCLCDTDLCNEDDKNFAPGAGKDASGEMKSLSLGAFLICGITIVSSFSLF